MSSLGLYKDSGLGMAPGWYKYKITHLQSGQYLNRCKTLKYVLLGWVSIWEIKYVESIWHLVWQVLFLSVESVSVFETEERDKK